MGPTRQGAQTAPPPLLLVRTRARPRAGPGVREQQSRGTAPPLSLYSLMGGARCQGEGEG